MDSLRSVPTIQPSQATQLVQALRRELELAKSAVSDRVKAKQHYDKAESIKAILLNYQAQQKARQQLGEVASPISIPSLLDTTQQSSQPSSPSPSPSLLDKDGNSKNITVEKLNQVKTSSESLASNIKGLEDSKLKETNPEKLDTINTELGKLKPKLIQYQKLIQYLKNELVNQGKMGKSPTPPPAKSTEPYKPTVSSSMLTSSVPTAPANTFPTSNPVPSAAPLSNPVTNVSYNPKPAIPISNIPLTNTKLPLSGYGKPLSAINRPPTTLGYSLSSPSLNKYPTYDSPNITPSSIPDNGGRVLTKRKLVEMANSIGAEEGDSKTSMDNDVEDLVLDLADEFVTSITSFACRIAKHRKVDKIDLRDFQLHLEKNWNIRIPGYTMDDVKAPKKWTANPEYSEKISEVDAAKNPNEK